MMTKKALSQEIDDVWKKFKDELFNPGYGRLNIRRYPGILELVDDLVVSEDISEELLKRIGRILGAKWRSEHVDYKRRI